MPKQFEKIRDAFLQLKSIKELLSRKITLATLGRAIESRKNGYIHAYEECANHLELRRFLHNMQQKVLKEIYVGELKMNLGKLTAEVRAFLGVLT